VIVEPNAIPGLTNRVLGKRVTRACVSWDETARYFRDGAVRVTGTPVRSAFLLAANRAQDTRGELLSVLVIGGSQGARALNESVPGAVAHAISRGVSLHITHQTGEPERDKVLQAYQALGVDPSRVTVTAFIDDVASAMARADLIVCRSGAGTVSELCVMGRPAVYVPLPTAADDHQRKNAEAIASRGAGECLLQRDLSVESLGDRLVALLSDRAALRAMGERALAAGHPKASHAVAQEVLSVAR
jgi:UDP-N-acetylglucosamine--N-acetylmuramyl-(pentapeptide) pyrophosphoryl-undecaprenol N-acetylglucosamine transferase